MARSVDVERAVRFLHEVSVYEKPEFSGRGILDGGKHRPFGSGQRWNRRIVSVRYGTSFLHGNERYSRSSIVQDVYDVPVSRIIVPVMHDSIESTERIRLNYGGNGEIRPYVGSGDVTGRYSRVASVAISGTAADLSLRPRYVRGRSVVRVTAGIGRSSVHSVEQFRLRSRPEVLSECHIYERLRILEGNAYNVTYRSVAGVDWYASTSIVTRSPTVSEVPESAVNGVADDATVEAKVGLVANMVVPFLLISIVVELVVPAVPTAKSAESTR